MELVFIGLLAGFFAGFFGVGGGMITVPLLLYAGVPIKFAIGISSMQMVFSSVYGTFRNIKNKMLDVKSGYLFGIGGVAGSFVGGMILDRIDSKYLGYLFLALLAFAIIRIFFAVHKDGEAKTIKYPIVNLIIGVGIGIIAGMLGVGGSVILIPILVSFLHYSTKNAASAGLFFVVFSSLAVFSTLSWLGYVDYKQGAIVAISSLFGVWMGQTAAKKSNIKNHKRLMVLMYVVLFIMTFNKIIG